MATEVYNGRRMRPAPSANVARALFLRIATRRTAYLARKDHSPSTDRLADAIPLPNTGCLC